MLIVKRKEEVVIRRSMRRVMFDFLIWVVVKYIYSLCNNFLLKHLF